MISFRRHIFIIAKNLRISLIRYNNKTYRIDDVDFENTPESTFTNSRGQEISYLQYYGQHYDIEIRDRRQCLLINMPRKKDPSEFVKRIYSRDSLRK